MAEKIKEKDGEPNTEAEDKIDIQFIISLTKFLKSNPTLFISIFFLFGSLNGLVYVAGVSKANHYNFFSFINLEDFFVLWLKDFYLSVVTTSCFFIPLAACIGVLCGNRLSQFYKDKHYSAVIMTTGVFMAGISTIGGAAAVSFKLIGVEGYLMIVYISFTPISFIAGLVAVRSGITTARVFTYIIALSFMLLPFMTFYFNGFDATRHIKTQRVYLKKAFMGSTDAKDFKDLKLIIKTSTNSIFVNESEEIVNIPNDNIRYMVKPKLEVSK